MACKLQEISTMQFLRISLCSLVLLWIYPACPLISDDLSQTKPDKSTQTCVAVFQQGLAGYAGTVDTEVWALAGNTILEGNPNASSDANNDGGESQVLLRFDDILGDAKWQVPKNAFIISARLEVSAFDQGSTVHLHRMLVPFTKSATWNSLIAGVSADGQEASRHKDSLTFGKIAANTSTVHFDVTDTVQYWANGAPNFGWVFLNTGGNGWDFYSSEYEDQSRGLNWLSSI